MRRDTRGSHLKATKAMILGVRSWWQHRSPLLPSGAGTPRHATARRGIMFGIPADTALAWANIIALSGLAMAAAGAFTAYQLSGRINAAHGLELQQVKS